jgi:hypothetical protein
MGTCIKDIENLLIQGEWRKADIETEKLIFSFYNSKKNSWLTPGDQRGIQLKSAMGIDYTRLHDLLAS